MLDRLLSTLDATWRWIASLFTNPYFWRGIGIIALVVALTYVAVDRWLMPNYTRYGVSVEVPDVTEQPYEEAAEQLIQRDLRVQREPIQQFNPNVPRDEVVDQNPPAEMEVKPDRRIYLTVNEGEESMVEVPNLQGISIREAQNQLVSVGLQPGLTEPDTIPAPYPNTVTWQSPVPGDSVSEGTNVTLRYSQGLGDAYISVPDVRGMTVREARFALLNERLRAVVADADEDMSPGEDTVRVQGREPDTEVREGSEIRLFIDPETDDLDDDVDIDAPDLSTSADVGGSDGG